MFEWITVLFTPNRISEPLVLENPIFPLLEQEVPCRKCGSLKGWYGPTYDAYGDKLVFMCNHCKYFDCRPCKDKELGAIDGVTIP